MVPIEASPLADRAQIAHDDPDWKVQCGTYAGSTSNPGLLLTARPRPIDRSNPGDWPRSATITGVQECSSSSSLNTGFVLGGRRRKNVSHGG